MTEGIDDGGPDEPTAGGPPRVLVVEDDSDTRDLYADCLAGAYDVTAVATGEAAVAALDDSVDVVLLDRRMPDLHGDDVLDLIRESGVDVRVAVVTGVDADLDLVGLPVDAYVEKPLEAGELRETVDRLVRVGRYDDRVRRYCAATQKLAALDDAPGVSEHDAAYRELVRRRETLERGVDDLRGALDAADYELLFRGIGGDGESNAAVPAVDDRSA